MATAINPTSRAAIYCRHLKGLEPKLSHHVSGVRRCCSTRRGRPARSGRSARAKQFSALQILIFAPPMDAAMHESGNGPFETCRRTVTTAMLVEGLHAAGMYEIIIRIIFIASQSIRRLSRVRYVQSVRCALACVSFGRRQLLARAPRSGFGSLLGRASLAAQVQSAIDETNVTVGLRKIAEHTTGERVEFLC